MKLAPSATLSAVLLAAWPALAQTGAAPAASTLSLSAVGDVKTAPDAADLNLGVASEAQTAAEALRDNSARMTAVIAALKRLGVADRDVRTQGINVQPEYAYTQNQPARLTGYRASNTVTVAVQDLDKVGALLDAAEPAGANQAGGLSFSIKDRAAVEDRARLEAVKALRAKAELYAQATGMKVGRLARLSEGAETDGPQPLPIAPIAMAARAGALPPVAAGEIDVRVQVNAVYELTR